MKPTPLMRLGRVAAKDRALFELLRDDPKAALRRAAKAGIKLSRKETKILAAAMSGRRVVVTFDFSDWVKSMHAATPRFKSRPGDWPLWGGHMWKWKVTDAALSPVKRGFVRGGARQGSRSIRSKPGSR